MPERVNGEELLGTRFNSLIATLGTLIFLLKMLTQHRPSPHPHLHLHLHPLRR